MFYDAKEFDSAIETHLVELTDSNGKIIKRYTAWDTGHVTDMSRMFKGAESFNRDISNWDVTNVKNIQ